MEIVVLALFGFAAYELWQKNQAANVAAAQQQAASASVSGPLGLPGADPYPLWDVHGNAYFRMGDGSVVAVYHSNDQRGDFPPPRVHDFAATVGAALLALNPYTAEADGLPPRDLRPGVGARTFDLTPATNASAGAGPLAVPPGACRWDPMSGKLYGWGA